MLVLLDWLLLAWRVCVRICLCAGNELTRRLTVLDPTNCHTLYG